MTHNDTQVTRDDAIRQSFKRVKEDMDEMRKQQELILHELREKADIVKQLEEAFSAFKQELVNEVKRDSFSQSDKIKDLAKKIDEMHKIPHNDASEARMTQDDVTVTRHDDASSSGGFLALNESEKRLVKALYFGQRPMSYGELSRILSLNYGTVKNKISSIKRKGFPVSEQVSKTGKEFFLENPAVMILEKFI